MTTEFPFTPGASFSAADAHRVGISARQLATAVAEGRLVRTHRGWYHVPGSESGRRAAHVRAATVALAEGSDGAIVSHRTAAALHRLPLLHDAKVGVRPAHLTVPRRSGGRRTPDVVIHPAPIADPGATTIDGMPVTGVARTIADLARTDGFDTGVCAADHALRVGMLTLDELRDEAERHRGRHGALTLRRVADFADGRSASPGESLSRCVIARFPEFEPPELQTTFFRPDGVFVARTDFDWDGRLVGEFDGKTKYTGRAAEGEDPGEVAWREKVREDEIRALGIQVVRWIWSDLLAPGRLRRILREGLRLLEHQPGPIRARRVLTRA